MVVVAVGHGALGVYVLTQGGVQVSPLKVVGSQGVARHEAVNVAVFHYGLHGPPGVTVESEGGAHHPDYLAVLLFVFQKLGELVVIPRI